MNFKITAFLLELVLVKCVEENMEFFLIEEVKPL